MAGYGKLAGNVYRRVSRLTIMPSHPEPEIEYNSPVPLYLQLRDLLRSRILDGTYPPGSTLPPQKELTARYKLARGTAARSVTMLQDDGLVVVSPGKGTYVNPRAAWPENYR